MDILKELWYGNVSPCEHPVKKAGDYQQALSKAMEETDNLLAKLPPDLQTAVENLVDSHMAAAALAERDSFIQGFRLGAQILADSLLASPVSSN